MLHDHVPICRRLFWSFIVFCSIGYSLIIVGVNYKGTKFITDRDNTYLMFIDFALKKTLYEINVVQGVEADIKNMGAIGVCTVVFGPLKRPYRKPLVTSSPKLQFA